MSNSVDPEETLDLCCLQKPIIIASGSERVNSKQTFTFRTELRTGASSVYSMILAIDTMV